ncbi:MAG: ECF transporter S component [Clostridium sp.]|nr:ECF transporter S component [Clostridium sp.]
MRQKTVAKPNEVRAQGNSKKLVITAVCIALTYVFTSMVNIRLPIGGSGGLIHLGNVPLFIAAILFGRKTGALAGGIGMALFDLLSGWTLWAPFTLVIVGSMGYVVGAITEKHRGFAWNTWAMICACAIKIAGYYIAEGIIYGNWLAPVFSIPGNLIQVGVAAALVLPVAGYLKKAVSGIMG